MRADTVTADPKRDLEGADEMRFIFGVLVGYSLRGKEKSLIIAVAAMAFIVYIVVPTVILSVALLALSLDVRNERRSRPLLTTVPAIKGLSYEDAAAKLRASNLNIRLLATRYDVPLQPGLVIDQVPQPGDEAVYGYPVGATIAAENSQHGWRGRLQIQTP